MATVDTGFAPVLYSSVATLAFAGPHLIAGNTGGPFNADFETPIFAVGVDAATGATTIRFTPSTVQSPTLSAIMTRAGHLMIGTYNGPAAFGVDGTPLPGFVSPTGDQTGELIDEGGDMILAATSGGVRRFHSATGTLIATSNTSGGFTHIQQVGEWVYACNTNGVWRFSSGDLTRDLTYPLPDEVHSVQGMAYVGDAFLVWGTFETFYGHPTKGLARVLMDGSVDTVFSVDLDGAVLSVVSLPDGEVAVAGTFATINGASAGGLVKLDPATGAVIATPGIEVAASGGWTAFACMAISEGTLYLTGEFGINGGPVALQIAKIDDFYEHGGTGDETGTLVEVLLLGAGVTSALEQRLRQVLVLGGAGRSLYDGRVSLRDRIAMADRLGWAVQQVMRERLLLGDSAAGDFTALVRILARLVLSGRARHSADALAVLVDALVLAYEADGTPLAELQDGIKFSDRVAALQQAVARALETLLLGDRPAGHQQMVAVLRESLVLGGELQHEADIVAALQDSIGFAATLSIDNGEYIAWVLNTESKGLSRYTDFPFNSFAQLGGRYAGATSAGLHWLDGDDDDGEPIHARLRLGLAAMGTRKLKRFPEVFIGYSSSGAMLLRAIVVDEETEEKRAAVYRIRPRVGTAMATTRAKLGRGLCSVDWDFELENVDGADFDLRSIEFRPVGLDRRTRG